MIQQNFVRAQLHGEQVTDLVYGWFRLNNFPNLIDLAIRSSFADEERAAFAAQEDGNDCEDETDQNRSAGVEVRIMKELRGKDSEKRDEDADQGCGILEEYRE